MRRNCSFFPQYFHRSNFSYFPQYFQYIVNFRSQIAYSFVKCACSIYFFFTSVLQIWYAEVHISQSKYFRRESIGLQDNERRLYLKCVSFRTIFALFRRYRDFTTKIKLLTCWTITILKDAVITLWPTPVKNSWFLFPFGTVLQSKFSFCESTYKETLG